MPSVYSGLRSRCAGLFVIAGSAVFSLQASAQLSPAAMQPFLQEHCYSCHGPEKQKGDIRLDTLSRSLEDIQTVETWQLVLDLIESGEMPPEKKPRPDASVQAAFVAHVQQQLLLAPQPETSVAATDAAPGPVSTTVSKGGLFKRLTVDVLNHFGTQSALTEHLLGIAASAQKASASERVEGRAELKHDELATAQPTDINQAHLKPFLDQHCVHCHGPEKQKGQVRFDTISWRITNNDEAQRWQDVLDVLNAGEMPPVEEPRPEKQELLSVLNTLTKTLTTSRKRLTDHGGVITMRRLNRREYVNTIRDLFGINLSMHAVPEDSETVNYDTVGSDQFFGSIHFDRYLELGTEIAKAGLQWSAHPLSEPTKHRHQPEHVAPKMRENLAEADAKKAKLDAGASWKDAGFPDEGDKEIFVRQFNSRYDPPRKYLSYPRSSDGLYLYNKMLQTDVYRFGTGHDPRATYRIKIHGGVLPESNPMRHYLYLRDEAPIGVLKVKGTVDAPQTIEVLDGPTLLADRLGNLVVLSECSPYDRNSPFFKRYLNKLGDATDFASIWIDWVEVEGPYYRYKENFFGNLIDRNKEKLAVAPKARELIERFAYKAFRHREPEVEYVDMLVAYFHQAMDSGKSYRDAMAETLGIVLASPSFLYIEETPKQADSRLLTQRSFAIRLAYFLWSSPPDDELYRLAESGSLYDPAELKRQLRRMLADPKADAFYEGFVSQWAELDRFAAISVDPLEYEKFSKGVRFSAHKEVIEFFKVLVTENLPVSNLIDSNFVVVNARLASYYGMQDIQSDQFQKVRIPDSSNRGGMITQTAFLTMGSNGERSSPVIRGTMVLDKILNDPPAPPPPNVPELGANLPRPMSNRELVEFHQHQTVCASCHSRIDPIGFGLENYDAIGQWRELEKVGNAQRPIEKGGQLVSGARFNDVHDLKRLLKTQQHRLAKELIESMLAYGLGRTIEFSDEEMVKELVRRCQMEDYSLQSMIYKVVTSPLFTQK